MLCHSESGCVRFEALLLHFPTIVTSNPAVQSNEQFSIQLNQSLSFPHASVLFSFPSLLREAWRVGILWEGLLVFCILLVEGRKNVINRCYLPFYCNQETVRFPPTIPIHWRLVTAWLLTLPPFWLNLLGKDEKRESERIMIGSLLHHSLLTPQNSPQETLRELFLMFLVRL